METMMTAPPMPRWTVCGQVMDLARGPLVMGVVNVTPDSFSDGGRFLDPGAAEERAERLLADGADLLDVGGESSRPGASGVSAEEEIRRVVPAIRAIRTRHPESVLSVDTTKARVAAEALEAGARIVNDISAGRADPEMFATVAESGAALILMHMQGEPRTMQDRPQYRDVVDEVVSFLDIRMGAAVRAGVPEACITLDPGFGFGKTLDHNLALLRDLDRLVALGRPVVVGVSRKSMLGALTGRPVDQRLAAGLAVEAFALGRGAAILRVHEAGPARDLVRVWRRLTQEEARP